MSQSLSDARDKDDEGRIAGPIDRRDMLRQTTALIAGAAVGGLGRTEASQDPVGSDRFFPGFKTSKVQTSGAVIHTVIGGQGPPLLLLHGAPQTHISWRRVAPELAKEYTVVATDLRGYGDSSKPPDGENHANYSKRAMALDQVEVMRQFGFEKFAVVGHDRGGRVTHRMALDHPDRVTKAAVVDIVPTYYLYKNITLEFANSYFHWFLFIQPAPFPENVITNDLGRWIGRGSSDASAEYLRVYKDPAAVHAMCEDYRAAATIDMKHDEADLDKKLSCPLLVLWGLKGVVGRLYDPLAIWRERASNVTGKGMPGGHNLQEELPEQTLAELRAFLKA
jgi:haloacetate dehalogenase